MAVYTTGRTRTITMTATLAGGKSAWWMYLNAGPTGGILEHEMNLASFNLTALVFSVQCSTAQQGFTFSGGNATFDFRQSLQVTYNGLNVIFTHHDTFVTVGTGGNATQTLDYAGSITISVDVEEIVTVDTPTNDFPTYGGVKTADPPYYTTAVLQERLKVGGTASISVSVGTMTGSYSTTITTASVPSYSQFFNPQIVNHPGESFPASIYGDPAYTYPPGLADTFAVSWTGTVPAYVPSYSYTVSGASVTATSVSIDGQTTFAVGGTAPPDHSANLSSTLYPLKSYSLSGQINRWTTGYGVISYLIDRYAGSGLATPQVTDGSGVLSDTYDQHQWSISSSLNGVSQPSSSLNEWQALRLWLRGTGDATSLDTLGEDTTDWRIPLRGWQFLGMQLQFTDGHVFDDASNLTGWTTGANVTLGGPGPITFAVAGGSGNPTKTYSPGKYFQSTRFVRVYLTGTTAVSGTITLTTAGGVTKTWNVTIPTTGYITLDLTAPTSPTATTDTSDSRWPLPTADGPYQGVSKVVSMSFSLPAGQTYTFSQIVAVVRLGGPRLTLLPAWNSWVADGSGNQVRNRLVQVDMDQGKQSLELTDFTQVSGVYTIRQLIDIANDVTATDGGEPVWPGWAVPSMAPNPDGSNNLHNGYIHNQREGCLAWAGGYLYGDRNGPGIDLLLNGAGSVGIDVTAQCLFDQIDWYPQIGNPFASLGNYGGAFVANTAKVLRGQAWGLVLDASHTPLPSVIITSTETVGGLDSGSGMSAAVSGEYFTSSPYGRTPISHKTNDAADSLSVTETWYGRKRHRICFVGTSQTPLLLAPWNYQDLVGFLHQVHTAQALPATLQYHRSEVAVTPWVTNSVLGVTQPNYARMIVDSRDRVLLLFQSGTGAGSQVYEVTSDSDGDSWSVGAPVARFAAGSQRPTIAKALDGTGILRAAIVGGNLQGLWQESPSAPLTGPTTFTSGGVAMAVDATSTFHLCQIGWESEPWFLHVLISGEGATSLWRSCDEGATWTRSSIPGITGGTYPTIAASFDGGFLVAAVVAQGGGVYHLVGRYVTGDGVATSPFTFSSGGAAISVANDVFGVHQGYESGERWVLSAVQSGTVKTWASGDEGATWRQVG